MADNANPLRAGMLDWAALVAGAGLVIGMTLFHFALWPPVAALWPHAPGDFAAAFSRHGEQVRMVLFPFGMTTLMLTLIALVREGGLGVRRGRLRATAVVALLALALLSTAGIEPVERAILASMAGAERLADADFAPPVAALLHRWLAWQRVSLAIVALTSVSLVLAHRAPMPPTVVSPDALSARHRTLLLLLGTATLFEGYDRFIVMLALPYIGADLGAGEGGLGWALSAIRIGALASIGLGRIADRHGRRRVLLLTILAYTLATAATGLSRGLLDFVLCQLVATIFLTAELALAQVVIAEEFPAGQRGRGQGLLGAFAALGAGVVAMLFPLLQKTMWGWRGLYFLGVLPLLLIAYLQRTLLETERWRQAQAQGAAPVPFFELLRPPHGLRLGVLLAVAFCVAAAGASAGGFLSYRATHTFGWSPSQVSTMVLTGGGMGMLGWFLFGRLADQLGRRVVGAVAFLGSAIAILAFYRTTYLFPAMTALIFMESGTAVAVNALGTELFPTRFRATGKAWITSAGIIGAMSGLATVGALADRLGGIEVVIPLLTLLPVLAAPLLYLVPETYGQELEVIAADDAGG